MSVSFSTLGAWSPTRVADEDVAESLLFEDCLDGLVARILGLEVAFLDFLGDGEDGDDELSLSLLLESSLELSLPESEPESELDPDEESESELESEPEPELELELLERFFLLTMPSESKIQVSYWLLHWASNLGDSPELLSLELSDSESLDATRSIVGGSVAFVFFFPNGTSSE